MSRNGKETKERLIHYAEQEFFNEGIQNASLRSICKKAGVTTGALYFFFESKEALFEELVGDVAENFIKNRNEMTNEEHKRWEQAVTLGEIVDSTADPQEEKQMMEYIFNHKKAFLLLVLKAKGSKYEGYYEELFQWMKNQFRTFMRLYFEDQQLEAGKMDALITTLVTWRVNAYLELLKSDMNLEQVLEQTELIAIYAVGGWNELMKKLKGGYYNNENK